MNDLNWLRLYKCYQEILLYGRILIFVILTVGLMTTGDVTVAPWFGLFLSIFWWFVVRRQHIILQDYRSRLMVQDMEFVRWIRLRLHNNKSHKRYSGQYFLIYYPPIIMVLYWISLWCCN